MLVIAHDYKGHLPFPGDEHGNLSFDFARNGRNLTGEFMRNNLMTGDSAPIKLLKSLILAGLEAGRFTVYLLDGRHPIYDSNMRIIELASDPLHSPYAQGPSPKHSMKSNPRRRSDRAFTWTNSPPCNF